jgi:hypothetical protein
VMNQEERVVRDEASHGPDLGREEVCREDQFRVGPEEGLPRRAAAAVRGRLDPVPPQDGLDRVWADDVTQVLERP